MPPGVDSMDGSSPDPALTPVARRTPNCLRWATLEAMAAHGDACPATFRNHTRTCPHCLSMIRNAAAIYREHCLQVAWEEPFESAHGSVAVFPDIRHVWPSNALRRAAGTVPYVWKATIALPTIVYPEQNVRVAVSVFPSGVRGGDAGDMKRAIPESVTLQATATTLLGEPMQNLEVIVRLGDEVLIAGLTDEEGSIATETPLAGAKLFANPVAVEVVPKQGTPR